MRRRHLQLLSLWILPLLLARALIPSGFMLSVDAGSLRLTFCPAGVVQRQSKQLEHSAHHAGMHHADAADEESASLNDNAPCPFSLVAAATPVDVPYAHDSASGPSDERLQFIAAPTVSVGPIRTDRIRGPPAIAS